jgi:hypothetical protein
MIAADILQLLVEATPLPPVEADLDELLYAFRDVDRRRQAIIDDLRAPVATTEEDRVLLAELDARHDAWRAALAIAKERLRGQLVGLRRARAYR